MSNAALYNKHRPMVFDDVLGQDDIIRVLKNQIMFDRVSHAYVFSGIRGTGKTTAARIFARAINCERPVDGNPCNECETCRRILSGASVNYTEWDAATHGLIDNIRDIENEILTRPVTGKYRVYVIDETQEMKAAAVNAFLKTLEEPPEYVIFILCTTSLKNMPPTITSRCQHYQFRRLSNELIGQELNKVLSAEGRSVSPEAVRFLSEAADGSMRDALTILDRVLSSSEEEETDIDSVLAILGTGDVAEYDALVMAMAEDDTGEALLTCNSLFRRGLSAGRIIDELLSYLRNLMLVAEGEYGGVAGILTEQRERVALTAEELGPDVIQEMTARFSELANIIRYRQDQQVLLECEIVKTCRMLGSSDPGEMEERLKALEEKMDALIGSGPQ